MPAVSETIAEAAAIFGMKADRFSYGSDTLSRKPHARGSNSALLTVSIIVGDVVGAGVLSMATAVAHLGWLGGTAMLVSCLLINVHVGILMWRVYMACPGATTYSELVDLAFAGASRAQRDFAVAFTQTVQSTLFVMILGIYLLTASKGLATLRYDLEICFPSWALGTCCLLLPALASTRTLSTWKWPIYANQVAMLMVIGIPLFILGREGPALEVAQRPVAVKSHVLFNDAMVALCAMFFAFSGQIMFVEIIAEMEDPADFPRCLGLYSAPFQLLIFTMAGVGGYLCLGDRVQGILLDYLPFGFALQAASVCLVMNMITAFCIKGVVTCRALHRAHSGDDALTDTSPAAVLTWKLIAAGLVMVAYLFSQVVPFFVELVDLAGAALVPTSCILIPIAMYVRLLYDAGSQVDMPGPLERILIGIEILIALGLTLIGTHLVITRIIGQWHLYGMPFDCHCEYIWKNCRCSAGRPGMEQCSTGQALVALAEREIFMPLFSLG